MGGKCCAVLLEKRGASSYLTPTSASMWAQCGNEPYWWHKAKNMFDGNTKLTLIKAIIAVISCSLLCLSASRSLSDSH